MPYTAKVFNVMLASPNDVFDERQAATETVHEWNNIHSLTKKIILMPLGWEYNSAPAFGDRPQEIINNQILKHADLLIGIFWTRIGTPTGKAVSGTVEEIEEHIKLEKPAMLYFSNKPVVPDSIDDDQYKAVKRLKEEYKNTSLMETFSSLEDFKTKFRRQLSITINTNKYISSNFSIAEARFEEDIQEALSNEAKQLLFEASMDKSGEIFKLSYIGGFSLQTNGKGFNKDDNPRSIAQWTSALDELLNKDLVIAVGNKGNIFKLTQKGYSIADSLQF
jgi:hypothetical protein